MRNRQAQAWWVWLTAVGVAAGMVGWAWAQDAPAPPTPKTLTPRAKAKARADALKKAPPHPPDPLGLPEAAKEKEIKVGPPGTFHYTFKITATDGTPLAASYFPSRGGTNAPVLLMVHEKDRSSKDFEEKIDELKGQGLAEHLQAAGYAVLLFDLRGHGLNPRRAPTPREWQMMTQDVQSAYLFLLDRNNRGEVNLAKFGVIGLGEGANLVAAWAFQGGGVSVEGRVSDINALVLISPSPTLVAASPDAQGFLFRETVGALAARLPVLLLAGERDVISNAVVRSARPLLERARIRQNKVELFDSSLHGYKLLLLEPKVSAVIARYLEGTVKFKAAEWEPRYNMVPVNIDNLQVARNRNVKPTEPAKAKDTPPAKEKAKEKEKEKDAAKE